MKKMLKLGASWCQPCNMLDKVLETAQINVEVEKIDIEKNPEVAQQYKIRGVPVCILFDEKGNEISRKSGYMTENELKSFIGE